MNRSYLRGRRTAREARRGPIGSVPYGYPDAKRDRAMDRIEAVRDASEERLEIEFSAASDALREYVEDKIDEIRIEADAAETGTLSDAEYMAFNEEVEAAVERERASLRAALKRLEAQSRERDEDMRASFDQQARSIEVEYVRMRYREAIYGSFVRKPAKYGATI
jgi:ribosome-associated translation inhibitor RaiA